MDKVERERSRWKEKEVEREREWRGKEKSWEAKLALAEQRVQEEVQEKKRLRECVGPLSLVSSGRDADFLCALQGGVLARLVAAHSAELAQHAEAVGPYLHHALSAADPRR